LQGELKKLEDGGVNLVGISYDSAEVLSQFAAKKKITFPLLSDPDSKTIKSYGLLDKDAKGKSEGVPYPGTMIVDKDGVIRAKLFYAGPFQRHKAEDILKAAAEKK
jgi:peroxiredoxin Q/BCP